MTLYDKLASEAEALADAIDAKQAAMTARLRWLESRLYELITDLYAVLDTVDGKIVENPSNYKILARIDKIWVTWQREFYFGDLTKFALDLLDVSALTKSLYTDHPEAILDRVAKNNELLRASLGIDPKGQVVKGSLFWELSQAAEVRAAIKNVFLGGIKSGMDLKLFQQTVKRFVQSNPASVGKLTNYWQTYAFDLYNQAAEIKNEQFREEVGLNWFIYVGDIIKDSRLFCIDKAGKVFAVVQADTEWPKDKNLIDKKTVSRYVPRRDRGRYRCRHRIRYITRELAVQLDPEGVAAIEAKYGKQS